MEYLNFIKQFALKYYKYILAVIIISTAFFYGRYTNDRDVEINTLKREIKQKNKEIDSVLKVVQINNSLIEQQKRELTQSEVKYNLLKSKYEIKSKNYEKLKKDYSTLSNDDKWVYFRTIINK